MIASVINLNHSFCPKVDSLVSARRESDNDATGRIKTEFLVQTQEDRMGNGVLLLGATNLPWALDIAMMRRFERRIYVGLPDVDARLSVLRMKLGARAAGDMTSLTEHDLQQLALATEGYSAADLSILSRDALMLPVRRVHRATHFRKVKRQIIKNVAASLAW